jgi:hypothetical protein
MKPKGFLIIAIFAALALYMLTSFKAADEKENSLPGGNRIVREYIDGKTFYVLLDYNDKAVAFIAK